MFMAVEEIKEKLLELGEVGESAYLIIQLLEIQVKNYEKLVKELEKTALKNENNLSEDIN